MSSEWKDPVGDLKRAYQRSRDAFYGRKGDMSMWGSQVCGACGGHAEHRSGCEIEGFPFPGADGRFNVQKVMDFVDTRNIERAEAIAEAWGTYAVLCMPWD